MDLIAPDSNIQAAMKAEWSADDYDYLRNVAQALALAVQMPLPCRSPMMGSFPAYRDFVTFAGCLALVEHPRAITLHQRKLAALCGNLLPTTEGFFIQQAMKDGFLDRIKRPAGGNAALYRFNFRAFATLAEQLRKLEVTNAS